MSRFQSGSQPNTRSGSTSGPVRTGVVAVWRLLAALIAKAIIVASALLILDSQVESWRFTRLRAAKSPHPTSSPADVSDSGGADGTVDC